MHSAATHCAPIFVSGKTWVKIGAPFGLTATIRQGWPNARAREQKSVVLSSQSPCPSSNVFNGVCMVSTPKTSFTYRMRSRQKACRASASARQFFSSTCLTIRRAISRTGSCVFHWLASLHIRFNVWRVPASPDASPII